MEKMVKHLMWDKLLGTSKQLPWSCCNPQGENPSTVHCVHQQVKCHTMNVLLIPLSHDQCLVLLWKSLLKWKVCKLSFSTCRTQVKTSNLCLKEIVDTAHNSKKKILDSSAPWILKLQCFFLPYFTSQKEKFPYCLLTKWKHFGATPC